MNNLEAYDAEYDEMEREKERLAQEALEKKNARYMKENGLTRRHYHFFYHGTRNENVWSILKTGLVLNPKAIITAKMFHRRADTLILYAQNERFCHMPRKIRIFGKILEITPAKGGTLDIHAGRKQNIRAIFQAIVRNRTALQIRRFHAPSVGQNANTRHSRRPISRLRFGYALF